jgi:hypothetical protein
MNVTLCYVITLVNALCLKCGVYPQAKIGNLYEDIINFYYFIYKLIKGDLTLCYVSIFYGTGGIWVEINTSSFQTSAEVS